MRHLTISMYSSIGLAIIVSCLLCSACSNSTAAQPSSTTNAVARQVFTTSFYPPGTQKVSDKGVSVSALDASNGKLHWSYQPQWFLGWHELANPVVADGVLYAPSDSYSIPFNASHQPTGFISALRATDGHALWRVEVGMFASQPVVASGIVYICAVRFTSSGRAKWVYALDARDGKQLWSTRIVDVLVNFHDVVRLVDGNLYIHSVDNVCFDMCGPSYLYSLDASNGKLRWLNKSTENATITPLSPFVVVNDALYFYASDLVMVALHASDGKPFWHYATHLSGSEGNYRFQEPTVVNGVVYTGAAIPSNPFRPDLWTYMVVALHGESGQVLWKTSTDLYPTVGAIDSNNLYVQTDRISTSSPPYAAFLTAMHIGDGKQLWMKQLGSGVQLLQEAGGVLYGIESILENATTLPKSMIVAVSASNGGVLWQNPLSPQAGSNSALSSYPLSVAYGIVAFGDNETLFVLRAKDGSQLWKTKTKGKIMTVTITT